MCGIVAVWGAHETSDVHGMMDRLSHRGPDATGVLHDRRNSISLGHRRLSIMDPSGGDQPLQNEDGTRAIVANGEIYNYARLRRHLKHHHSLASSSDSESILHLYEELGPRVAGALDGMFSFAILDSHGLFVARDPIGIKPLYYVRDQQRLVFASEIKALLPSGGAIRLFPPGTLFFPDAGFRRYYSVPRLPPRTMPLPVRLHILRETLQASVRKRLMSDVPVGTLLSGGLDSAIVTALARPYVEPLHTFSVGIEGSPDLEAARSVARFLGTRHHEYLFTADEVMNRLPEIIYYLESFDVDLVRSAIPCYFAARLAAQNVKVVLTGEGADELFAGYRYHRNLAGSEPLHDELHRSVTALHSMNLQRVDRMTMAHSLEARVPFLDLEMINVAQSIPPELKLPDRGSPGKWILRRAFADLLPRQIIERAKSQFDEGSGTTSILDRLIPGMVRRYGIRPSTDAPLRAAESQLYRILFRRDFPPETDALVACWVGADSCG